MGRQLVSYVHVMAEDGFTSVAFGPDDDVPAWAAEQMGDHCFVAEDSSDDGPPPLSGKGSGIEAWRTYAEALSVPVDPDAKREDIIAAISDAGHPVEPAQ